MNRENYQPKFLNTDQADQLENFGFRQMEVYRLDQSLERISGLFPWLNRFKATSQLRSWLIEIASEAAVNNRISEVRTRQQNEAFSKIEIQAQQLRKLMSVKNR